MATPEELDEYFHTDSFAVESATRGVFSLISCSKCAAVIRYYDMEQHVAWHKVWHQ